MEITTAEWQQLILAELKESNIVALIIGAGGHLALNANRRNRLYFEQLRSDLQDIAAAIIAFTAAILAGEKTAGQIRGWIKRQSRTMFRNYHKASRLTKVSVARHNEAMRFLGLADHCPDCPALTTEGEWRPIEDVVLPTMQCRCGQIAVVSGRAATTLSEN